jgi:NTE family protein
VCAVRQRDGRLVVFGRDSDAPMANAVAASCAIPGFFRPVEIDGENFVDGGAHSPTNADLLRREAPALVIVSSPMSYAGAARLTGVTPVRRWSRLLLDGETYLLRRSNAEVVAFQPTQADIAVMGLNPMDPLRRADIARQAYQSTVQRLARPETRERLAALR